LNLPDDEQPKKRRKLSFTSVLSLPSSPIKKDRLFSSSQEDGQHAADENQDAFGLDTDEEEDDDRPRTAKAFPPRLIPYRAISSSAAALSKRLGSRTKITEANDSTLWQHEASNFYSSPEDVYAYNRRSHSLPFCAAGFKTVPLVAVGDEDGSVRIHDASADARVPYQQVFITMHPHDNAIMDLELSSDDALLATASGDQSCRIVDMKTQIATHTLVGHTGSVKRIQFQPNSGDNVLATCSRDGSVCLWDLRCAKAQGSTVFRDLKREPTTFLETSRETNPTNQMREAHTSWDRRQRGVRPPRHSDRQAVPARYDFAVTTCAFVGASRPHLLATASENDAIIKLWDTRTSYKRGRPVPVSATLEPRSHETHRQFGVTSMTVSTDGSRLYSLCRDQTVYAYATAHLVVGGAPEMSPSSTHPFRQSRSSGSGLGPLYGFRHPSLRLQTFYDKLAVRHRTQDRTEMIATGSSEECAVVFPTDERYLNKVTATAPEENTGLPSRSRSAAAARTRSSVLSKSWPAKPVDADDCPIYHHGTALVNGHRKEVTAVAWTHNGNLVTTADDYTTRLWREDAGRARSLRLNVDRDVGRHQCGWADVRPGFDDDEDED
jgi:WD40 repeat protein